MYIVGYEYGPLFVPPPLYHGQDAGSFAPWEVNRIRVSLTSIAALHAQGGVGPQVTSHIFGLLRARPSFAHLPADERRGLEFLASEDGAEWVLRTINEVCRIVDGAEEQDREELPSKARL